ncbi:MAG: TolC family protein, partial [Pyrinomonadaceae bacterium]
MKKRLLVAEIECKGAYEGTKTQMTERPLRGPLRLASLGAVLFVLLRVLSFSAMAQTGDHPSTDSAGKTVQSSIQDQQSPLAKYFDPTNGLTVDGVVAYALANNGEVLAARKEIEAARALVKQAGLRANPALEVNGSRQLNGKDNSIMVGGMLPLELGGRRAARITVAERELELREQALADRERVLAAEVRAKFGQALSEVLKLGFTEDLLKNSRSGYRLVEARVVEGRTAPLEQNMLLVEVNQLRSMRETSEGRVEITLLELRNLIGVSPEQPLKLRGDFTDLIDPLTPIGEATEQALHSRPDLGMARVVERLAEAKIAEARAAGRPDVSLNAGYQRMNSSFPVFGINDGGQLRPVQDVFNFITFGVTINLPVRNKNQGAIEASVADSEAAKKRREFGELTVRREVATAYVQYERAARA